MNKMDTNHHLLRAFCIIDFLLLFYFKRSYLLFPLFCNFIFNVFHKFLILQITLHQFSTYLHLYPQAAENQYIPHPFIFMCLNKMISYLILSYILIPIKYPQLTCLPKYVLCQKISILLTVIYKIKEHEENTINYNV